MPKLILKRGLPGSGKSTSAREQVEKDGNTMRINFDDLRAMLFNSKWSPKREEIVNEIAVDIVETLSYHGLNVIIDNTNLTDKHVQTWKQRAKAFEFQFEEQIHDASIETCVERDQERYAKGGHVGRAVIERLAISSGWFKFKPEEKIVICDVDGTLADSAWRAEAFLRADEKDWPSFFEASYRDKPIEAVANWVREIYRSGEYTIVICSGRSDDYSTLTCDWLKNNHIPFHHILMRKSSDRRPDDIVKNEILNMLPKQQISFIIDDRNSVCNMWRQVKQQENLTYHVFQVAEGNF